VFGIPNPVVPYGRLVGFVDEMVDHRNAVSHGRKTAYEVGRGLTTTDILDRVKFTQDICMHIIETMEQHCSDATKVRRIAN
jgi:hypothetical protein